MHIGPQPQESGRFFHICLQDFVLHIGLQGLALHIGLQGLVLHIGLQGLVLIIGLQGLVLQRFASLVFSFKRGTDTESEKHSKK